MQTPFHATWYEAAFRRVRNLERKISFMMWKLPGGPLPFEPRCAAIAGLELAIVSPSDSTSFRLHSRSIIFQRRRT
jgi:hypothetical protein